MEIYLRCLHNRNPQVAALEDQCGVVAKPLKVVIGDGILCKKIAFELDMPQKRKICLCWFFLVNGGWDKMLIIRVLNVLLYFVWWGACVTTLMDQWRRDALTSAKLNFISSIGGSN
jgi:hypothetical protein